MGQWGGDTGAGKPELPPMLLVPDEPDAGKGADGVKYVTDAGVTMPSFCWAVATIR